MENHEEKKGCCENKEGGMGCGHGMMCEHGMGCCHNWKKCHMMKKIIVLILLIIAFCLGSQWGERKSEWRGGDRFERGGMMNWGYGKFDDSKKGDAQQGTASVTVEVAKPAAPAAAPKQ
ncbi:hypothetical protein HXX01_02825 [Candidatus Nomurabacteria bacterium]|nr:hypothetical protein [Candidatus Nomurabacteria bacterium]